MSVCIYSTLNKMKAGLLKGALDEKHIKNNHGILISPAELWIAIGNKEKCHDSQMNVVCALWNAGMIKREAS
jgi:hypothetical protein